MSIDQGGGITGYYYFRGAPGFMRAGDGFTTFDPPGSINTYPLSINSRGSITGYYFSSKHGMSHGFVAIREQ